MHMFEQSGFQSWQIVNIQVFCIFVFANNITREITAAYLYQLIGCLSEYRYTWYIGIPDTAHPTTQTGLFL